MSFFGLFGNDLAIDLGTSNVRVYVRDKGVVIEEPCVVAVHSELRRQVLAVGEEAKSMMGRTPGGISAIRPMHEGVIADFDVTEVMLRYLIKKAGSHYFSLMRPRVVITVPCGVTPVERRAVDEAARNAGARAVYIVEEPMAAAIGAGLPIASPTGSMIVNIGGGTCEVAVLSLGGIVAARSIRMGGDKFDAAIIEFIKREHNLLIGERTAEDVKMTIGSAMLSQTPMVATVRGRDLISGFPQTLQVDSDEIREAMREPLAAVLGAIKAALESTPPELSADIMQRGIVLCGGGCLLGGLETLISMETGIPVFLAEDPTQCVIQGAGRLTQDADLLHLAARNSRED
jgi:rod shape-determining protein MreB